MKMTLSKAQWAYIGEQTGWMKTAQVENTMTPDDTEWQKEVAQVDSELDAERDSKQKSDYSANVDTQYYVTIYRTTDDETFGLKKQVVDAKELGLSANPIPIKGLESAENIQNEMEDKFIDRDDLSVYLETTPGELVSSKE